jgi:drug resistance transporter, Bcr/CflA subfamily
MAEIVAAPRPIMTAGRVSFFGALLIAVGPISMTLYSPAMTSIAEALDTTEAMVKLTMTSYFAGFAFAQLLAGPASDALGRKPVTCGFLALFLLGTVIAIMAPGVELLIFGRLLQGLGAAAGAVISRAIIRDVFEGEESSRIMNLIGIILAVGPAFAPTLGAIILTYLGWQWTFVFMFAFGALILAVTIVGLRETAPLDRPRFRLSPLMRSYGQVLRNRSFLASTAVIAGAVGIFYAQSTLLPFVLMGRVGLNAGQFGMGMLLQWGGYFAGALVVRWLMDRRVNAMALVVPGLVIVGIACVFLLNLLFLQPSYLSVMLPVALLTFGNAFVGPAMTTATLAPFPKLAGTAASLMGFLQMTTGLVASTLASLVPDPVAAFVGTTVGMCLLSSVAFVLYRLTGRGEEPAP